MIYLQLYWEFIKVGLFCVGGGYASMPLIQAAVVEGNHWLSLPLAPSASTPPPSPA